LNAARVSSASYTADRDKPTDVVSSKLVSGSFACSSASYTNAAGMPSSVICHDKWHLLYTLFGTVRLVAAVHD